MIPVFCFRKPDPMPESASSASAAAISLVEKFEALRLTPYHDANGFLTCGWGHKYTSLDHYPTPWTRDLADMVLKTDLATAAYAVKRFTYVYLSQPQFDGLVSLVFNIGLGEYHQSTLLKKLNASDYHGAADQILVWNKIKGEVNHWQTERRMAEHLLFLSGTK